MFSLAGSHWAVEVLLTVLSAVLYQAGVPGAVPPEKVTPRGFSSSVVPTLLPPVFRLVPLRLVHLLSYASPIYYHEVSRSSSPMLIILYECSKVNTGKASPDTWR